MLKISTGLIACTSLFWGVGINLISSQPATNQNGDYQLKYEEWEVIDPDPKGLNCRAVPKIIENPSDAVWGSGMDDISK
jgi:hypothetical protein